MVRVGGRLAACTVAVQRSVVARQRPVADTPAVPVVRSPTGRTNATSVAG